MPTMRKTLNQKVKEGLTGQPQIDIDERMGDWLMNKRNDIKEQLVTIENGDEAVAFFARNGKTNPIKILYCNRTDADITVFRPYDLSVVPEKDILSEHYTISKRGVVHIKPSLDAHDRTADADTHFCSLSEWMKQTTQYDVVSELPFFKE